MRSGNFDITYKLKGKARLDEHCTRRQLKRSLVTKYRTYNLGAKIEYTYALLNYGSDLRQVNKELCVVSDAMSGKMGQVKSTIYEKQCSLDIAS
jgi:hypothetical protein